MSDIYFNKIVNSLKTLPNGKIERATSKIVFGTVAGVDPLSVQIDGMEKPLPYRFLILGQACKNYKVRIPHTHSYNMGGGTAETEDVTQDYVEFELFKPLEVGDRVLMFSFNSGQRYYIAEKVLQDDTIIE